MRLFTAFDVLFPLVLDLVEGVLGEDDGLKAVVGENLTRPENLAHGGREQVLRHALRLAEGDVCLDLCRGHSAWSVGASAMIISLSSGISNPVLK